MLFFAIMQAFAKALSETHSVIEIAFYRNAVSLIPLLAWVAMQKKIHLLKTAKPVALFFRAVVGTAGLIATFAAIRYLPLADATVIFLTSVLMIPALSFFFLKEHIGIHRWSTIILGLLGVILMVNPTGHVQALGALIAFIGAIAMAAAQVFLRHLRTESAFTVTFYFILSGVIIPGLFMPFIAVMPTPRETLLLLGTGFTGLLGQFFLTSSLKLAPTSVIAPLNYTGLLWATILDIVFWNYIPGVRVFAGAAIIIASQAYIIHREKRAQASEQSLSEQ